jgi:hypothetical protein
MQAPSLHPQCGGCAGKPDVLAPASPSNPRFLAPGSARASGAGHAAYSRGVSEHTQKQPTGGAVQRARADLAAGREWKARDRLTGHLAGEYDAEALELLGEVYYAMRDLPSAGAAWFGTNRRGEDVDQAILAWRERHHDHFAQMWSSLPRSVRGLEGNKRVDALRRRAEHAVSSDKTTHQRPAGRADTAGGGVDAATVIAIALGVLFVACAVIGFVTLLQWVVPGS